MISLVLLLTLSWCFTAASFLTSPPKAFNHVLMKGTQKSGGAFTSKKQQLPRRYSSNLFSSSLISTDESDDGAGEKKYDDEDDEHDEHDDIDNDFDNTINSRNKISPISPSNHQHLTDPTSMFNNDILRIASRTNARRSSNFNPIHAAEHAERMLLQMISMYQASNRKKARPNIETFRIVLMGYANLKGIRWYKNNQGDENNELSSSFQSSFGYTSSASTNIWGDEFVKELSGDSEKDVDRQEEEEDEDWDEDSMVEGRFDEEEEMNDATDTSSKKQKSNKSLSTQLCAADRVEFIMEQLMKLQQSELEAGYDISSLELNTDTCNMCLLAYARCSYPQSNTLPLAKNDQRSVKSLSTGDSSNEKEENVDASEQHEQHEQQELLVGNPFLLSPSQRGSYAERAEKLVKYMIYLSKKVDLSEADEDDDDNEQGRHQSVDPDSQTYSYLIWALSKQQPNANIGNKRAYDDDDDGYSANQLVDNNHYASRASEWVPHMETLYRNDVASKGQYNHKRRILRKYLLWAYSDILTSWSKCSGKKSPRKVYKFMTLIEGLCEEDELELNEVEQSKRNRNEYDDEFDDELYVKDFGGDFSTSWSNSMRPPSNDKYAPYLDRNTPLYPNAQCYTTTILSLSKSKELGSAQRANQLLFKMLKIYESGQWGKNRPSVYAFNGVISAWANCAAGKMGNADKAERILNLMEELYFDESKPEYDHLSPDLVTFNTAIKAWTNSKEDAAVLKAERLMERMEERYNSIGSSFLDVKPDKYTYNTLITGWLRSDLGITSAENAESLLRKMVEKYLAGDETLEPHQKIFSSIIDKWAKSDPSRNIAVKHSLGLLKLMETLDYHGCSHLSPDKVTYTNIIDAIARSRSPKGAKQALSLLTQMEEKYKNGDHKVKPSAQTYSCTLLSLLNSDMEDKHLIAQNIPKRMRDINVDPNAFTWNYIIHVASSIRGHESRKMEAFKVALGSFQALRKSKEHDTDSFTYTFFLKALNHLISDNVMRSSIAKETFMECANEGKVNDQVLTRLVWAIPTEELRELLGPIRISDIRNVKAHDLPIKWRRNVYQKRSKRKLHT